MSINLYMSHRFERKADLLDNAIASRLNAKINRISEMDFSAFLRQSSRLRSGFEASTELWVAPLFNEYRLIFRPTENQSIELMDIVAYDDLSKFIRSAK